jgi:hypothetical protein
VFLPGVDATVNVTGTANTFIMATGSAINTEGFGAAASCAGGAVANDGIAAATRRRRRDAQARQQRWSATLYDGAEKLGQVDFDDIDSRFHFILLLAQSETERILREALQAAGVHVERETEMIAFAQAVAGQWPQRRPRRGAPGRPLSRCGNRRHRRRTRAGPARPVALLGADGGSGVAAAQ